jgi:hypothetical protein
VEVALLVALDKIMAPMVLTLYFLLSLLQVAVVVLGVKEPQQQPQARVVQAAVVVQALSQERTEAMVVLALRTKVMMEDILHLQVKRQQVVVEQDRLVEKQIILSQRVLVVMV